MDPTEPTPDPTPSTANPAPADPGQRFHTLIETSADGVVVLSEDGRIAYANPAAGRILALPNDSLVGCDFGRPVVPGEISELDIRHPNGSLLVVEMRVVATVWDGVPASLALLRDVTERHRAAEAQRLLIEAGAALADSLDLPTTLDSLASLSNKHLADGCFIDLLASESRLDRTLVEVGDSHRRVIARGLDGTWTLAPGHNDHVLDVLRSGRSWLQARVELSSLAQLTAPGDQTRLETLRLLGIHSLLVVPLRAHGQVLGLLTLLRFSPAHPFLQADLPLAEPLASRAALAIDNARLYDEAQEGVRRRDQLLAMLAHELRNPLMPISNAATIIRLRSATDPVTVLAGRVIERQVRHLSRLLDDLLDVSRFTRGTIRIDREVVDLQLAIDAAVQTVASRIESRSQTLRVSTPNVPVHVHGDSVRLEQIVINLLTNASKFTPVGGLIEISLTADTEKAQLTVRDNGIGIESDPLNRIFEPFFQVGDTLDRAQSGLGVGLTLVRTLVELHDGQIVAESPGAGLGTTFRVTLPCVAATSEVEPTESAAPPTALRILLVEDLPDNRDMLSDLLVMWGHHIEVAPDGEQGFNVYREKRPDVALIDIGLPGIDGYELARRIRALDDDHSRSVRLIALTGYAQPDDRDRVRDAGFDHHLVKPVELEILSRYLLKVSPTNGESAHIS